MGEAAELPSLGGSIALSFVSLGVVCLLAWVVLRWISRRGPGSHTGPVRVLARCPLEPRRSLYLIEAVDRCFLVAVGDGSMALLAELDTVTVRDRMRGPPGAGTAGFGGILARVLSRSPESRAGG